MGITEEALESRNEGLFRLRDIDIELSVLLRPVEDDEYFALTDERQRIVEALVVMNCEPWALGEEPWLK